MHGIFLLNSNNEVAFAQLGEYVRIEAFRYIRDARACVVVHSNGQEELFTTEQPQPLIDCLERSNTILVAHVDEAGQTITEYSVPLHLAG